MYKMLTTKQIFDKTALKYGWPYKLRVKDKGKKSINGFTELTGLFRDIEEDELTFFAVDSDGCVNDDLTINVSYVVSGAVSILPFPAFPSCADHTILCPACKGVGIVDSKAEK